MVKKAYAVILLIPLFLFFFTNETLNIKSDSTIFEAGVENLTINQKLNFLLPENEIALPKNEISLTPKKYKIKDIHKLSGKRFYR